MSARQKIFIIKFVHSILFWFMVVCLLYILYCAITSTFNGALLAAIVVILVEGLALALSGFRCPLTILAEKYGSANGSVTHLFIPMFCARYVFKFFTALFVIELVWLGFGYFA